MRPPALSIDDVRHVADLARLRLDDDELERGRRDLEAILGHVRALERIDIEGVEPMTHPGDIRNRLDDDVPTDPMPRRILLDLAPAAEADHVAVPRVLG